MIILDSNLWVFGLLGRNDRTAGTLDDIQRGETVSAINAYMVQEVLDALERTPQLAPAQRDEAQTAFLTRMHQMTGLLEAPSSRDMTEAILDETRNNIYVRFIAQSLDIQRKDVPLLVLAYKHSERNPTILTNDEAFAACVPKTITTRPLPSNTSHSSRGAPSFYPAQGAVWCWSMSCVTRWRSCSIRGRSISHHDGEW